jgi:hypothetical protein
LTGLGKIFGKFWGSKEFCNVENVKSREMEIFEYRKFGIDKFEKLSFCKKFESSKI